MLTNIIFPIPCSISSRWALPPIFGCNSPHHTQLGNYVKFGSYVLASESNDGGKWDLTGPVRFNLWRKGRWLKCAILECNSAWNTFKRFNSKSRNRVMEFSLSGLTLISRKFTDIYLIQKNRLKLTHRCKQTTIELDLLRVTVSKFSFVSNIFDIMKLYKNKYDRLFSKVSHRTIYTNQMQ